MESIEFRAWYFYKDGIMIPWNYIMEDRELLNNIIHSKPVETHIPFDVMFYTGCSDSTEKHIYRLDILRQENSLYLVSWFADRLQWWAQGMGTAPDKPLWELSIQNDIFVVGNGYETPSLIKQLNT